MPDFDGERSCLRCIQRRIARTFLRTGRRHAGRSRSGAAARSAAHCAGRNVDLRRAAARRRRRAARHAAPHRPPEDPSTTIRGVGLCPTPGLIRSRCRLRSSSPRARGVPGGLSRYVTRDGRLFADESHAPRRGAERFAAALSPAIRSAANIPASTAGGRPGVSASTRRRSGRKADGGVVRWFCLKARTTARSSSAWCPLSTAAKPGWMTGACSYPARAHDDRPSGHARSR